MSRRDNLTKKEFKAALELYKPINLQPKSTPNENEHTLQAQCVNWFRLTHKQYEKLLFAIPNGGKRNIFIAKKLKKEGVVSGVPDLFLAVPSNGYFGMFIEMKYGQNTTTENQKKMIDLLETQNYKVVVCKSFHEFQTAIHGYLNECSF